jgi:prepilin-type N-terminal cleavage/methylation domain-containing protein
MSGQRKRARRSDQHGYTLVELMMALALFTVAVLGIISMQKVMVVSNAHAKNVSVAQRIAQSWAAQLQLDATRWRTDMTSTDWLKLVDGGWTKPDYKAGRKFGKAFDALGSPLSDSAADLSRASYCASVRITTLYSDSEPVMGNGMVRAEIRVYWLRDGASMLDDDGICGGTELQLNTASDRYHFVYHTAGIRQQASI